MYRLEYTTNFKKDLKTCKKRGLELHLLQRVIDILQETGTLPNQYRPHKLSGKFEGLWISRLCPNEWKCRDIIKAVSLRISYTAKLE